MMDSNTYSFNDLVEISLSPTMEEEIKKASVIISEMNLSKTSRPVYDRNIRPIKRLFKTYYENREELKRKAAKLPIHTFIILKFLKTKISEYKIKPEMFIDQIDREVAEKTLSHLENLLSHPPIPLNPNDLKKAGLVVKFINEIPMLQYAIKFKEVQRFLINTQSEAISLNEKFKYYLIPGIILCLLTPFFTPFIVMPFTENKSGLGFLMIFLFLLALAADVFLVFTGLKINNEYVVLSDNRDDKARFIRYKEQWNEVVNLFGNHGLDRYKFLLEERTNLVEKMLVDIGGKGLYQRVFNFEKT
ncbi:MAG: hypothetical protein ACP5FK_06175 [bacterium]